MTTLFTNSGALVLCLLAAGCASSSWAGFELTVEPGKQEDDLSIASLAEGTFEFSQIVIKSSDGLPIPGYLFEPLGAGGEVRPAVIYLHGGEHGTFSAGRVARLVPLIQKGWMVLALDYRGSSGYGPRFHDAADYGGLEIDDVLAARDWLVRNHAHEAGVAVLGSSHGGYNALMAAARRPDGFAACVDFYGPTDLVYRVTSTPEENPNTSPGDPERFAGMVGATIEENEQAYRDRSPRFLADQIRAPVLIIHGIEDGVVQIQESEWLVEALGAAQHGDYEFIRVAGGKHGYPAELYRSAWKNAIEFLEQRFADR